MGIGRKSVYLGRDATLYPEWENQGTEETGIEADKKYAEGDSNNNEMEAMSTTGGGYGSVTAWAKVGRVFKIEDDSGSEWATISATSDVLGQMSSFNDGNQYAKIKFTIEDLDDDEVHDDVLFEKSDYQADINETVTGSVNVNLQAQHSYSAEIETIAEVTVDGDAEEAASDFSREYDGNHHVTWEEVNIKF